MLIDAKCAALCLVYWKLFSYTFRQSEERQKRAARLLHNSVTSLGALDVWTWWVSERLGAVPCAIVDTYSNHHQQTLVDVVVVCRSIVVVFRRLVCVRLTTTRSSFLHLMERNSAHPTSRRNSTQRNQEPHWRRRSLQQSMRLLPSARINTAGSVTADVTSRHVRSAASWIPDYFRQNQVYSSLIFFLSEVSLRFVNSAAVTSSIETRSCFSFITTLPMRLQFCYIVIYFLSSVFQSRFCLLFCRLRLPAD